MCLPLPMIPLFVEAQDLHLYDSRIGYIILHWSRGCRSACILLTAFVIVGAEGTRRGRLAGWLQLPALPRAVRRAAGLAQPS